MPHIVVEYSSNLTSSVKESDLLRSLHRVVLDSGIFSPEAIKARGVSYDEGDYVLPEGKKSFLHVTVSILAGRDTEPRRQISDSVFKASKALIPSADSVSVNLHEMDEKTYKK